MEKRTLLAIVLSFGVLIIYSFIFPQSRPKDGSNKPQVYHNNKVMSIVGESNLLKNFEKDAEILKSKQKLDTLETDNLLLTFSNRGGILESIFLRKYNYTFPIKNIFLVEKTGDQIFSVEKKDKNKVIFSFENSDFFIRKIYEVEDHFTVKVKILFLDKNKMSKIRKKYITGFQLAPPNLDDNSIVPAKEYFSEKSLYEYVVASSLGIFRKDNANAFDNKYLREFNDKLQWFGFRDRYFCLIIKNIFETKNLYVIPREKYSLELNFDFNAPPQELNEPFVLDSLIFAGPQDFKILKSVDSTFPQILNFKIGGFMDFLTFGMTDFFTKLIIHFLDFVHRYTQNWGISIIILSIFIFILTYPLTIKSMLSMKKMQALQPEMTKIREQFKNNPEKINKEMMGLYKKHKFNPFGGCLPMFLQMPIFVSLYQVLWRSFNFKGAQFLWIKDLSEADRLILLNFSLPFFGNEINILPFFVILFMFLQQKFSSKSLPGADPAQIAQQKMMARLMPIMIGVLFYKVASGLCLYFTVFYFFSTIMQWKMSKIDLK